MPNYYHLNDDPNQARIIAGLRRLREQLDAPSPVGIPQRSMDRTMRLATWNIREFDSAAYGDRMSDAYYYLAEIISRFDLVAIQEVRRNLDALNTLMNHLGWQWRYLVTDTTEGDPGNDERLAFLYDTRKVRFSGLSGELVLPDIKVRGQAPVKPDQIVRTPFTAGFTAGWLKLQLATVHILYGKGGALSPERIKEIKSLATFLAARADDGVSASPNLVLLGDFNIFAKGDATMTALTDAGWSIPTQIRDLPAGSNVAKDKFYDQIAVLPKAHEFRPAGPAGIFDFYQSVFRLEDRDLYATDMGERLLKTATGTPRTESGKTTYYKSYWRTYQMSDHLPMWIDLMIDFSDEYISGLAPPPPPPGPNDIT